ncbi:MAG: hypothetical protein AAGG80_05510 [Pseudomonadota bacterium]
MTLNAPNIKQREINGLIEALETHSLNQGLILTKAEEFTETTRHHKMDYQNYH